MKKERRNTKKKVTSIIVSFLLVTAFMGTLAFAAMPTAINADSLKNQDSSLPKVTGYKAYTNHQGPAPSVGADDNQYVYLDVYYDSSISIVSSEEVVKQVKITYAGASLNATTKVRVGDDGKSLHFEMKFPFAGMYGNLAMQSVLDGNNTLTAVKKAGSDTSVNFPEVYLIVSNGILLDKVSQSAGTSSTPALFTKKINQLPSATRGAVQFIFLRDGKPVGTVSAVGANLVAHFHMYLSLDASTYCSYLESAFNGLNKVGGMFNGYSVIRDGANLTIKADNATAGEVLDLLQLSYPNDRNTYADKSELSKTVAESDKFISNNTIQYPDLVNETAIAKSYVNCIYYTQEQVDAETQNLHKILEAIYTHTLEFSSDDTVTGIAVNAKPGTIPYGTELSVKVLTTGETYEAVKGILSSTLSKYTVFDLSLISKNVSIEPNGTVTVAIPLPDGYPESVEKLALYHIVNGEKISVTFTLQNKKIVFDANSLSPYVIADLVVDTPVADTPVADTPVADTPVADTPVIDTPVADLVAETTSLPAQAIMPIVSPSTGDHAISYVWILLAIFSISTFSALYLFENSKKSKPNSK